MRVTVAYTPFYVPLLFSLVSSSVTAADLAAKGQGKTAQEVLDTGQILVLMEKDLLPEEFQIFCKGTGWHPKVITKLLVIGRDKRLLPLLSQLPGSYSAIYPLTTLSDAELDLAVSESICRSDASTREIIDWIKVKRLEGMNLPESNTFTGTSANPLTKEQKVALLAALQKAALPFDVTMTEGAATAIGTRKATKTTRDAFALGLLTQLTTDLIPVIEKSPEALLKEFDVYTAADLATGEIRNLTGILVRLCNGTEGMWNEYGSVYCHKIALEFNRTESRAQRFNYRKRLLEVKQRHPHLAELVDDIVSIQLV